MADRLDVAERLAEGRVAIERTQAYVRACQTMGYEHPDLTSHPSQIRDWFDSEEGLDLRVLDRDCALLRAAGAAAVEGLRIQQQQVAELVAAWMGAGSDAAVAFLQRHCDAANVVATEVRAAAQRCESLRDNLWYLLDSKVGAAIAIDDRSQAQRSAWLAAAAVVTAGAGERSTAEQVVRGQVMPYVDNDIRNDWLTAMRSSLAAFGTAYDMVNDRMASAGAAYFEMPGDLGPGFPPPQPSPGSPPQPLPAATAPAAVLPTVAPDPAPLPVVNAPAAVPTPAAPPLSDPSPPVSAAAPPLSDVGAGLGDAAALPAASGGLGDSGGGAGGPGGLSGLAGRIVDALGGLLGSATDGLGDSSGLDDPMGNDPFDEDEDPFKPDDEHDDEERDKADAEKTDEPKEADEAQPVSVPPAAQTPPLPVGEPAPVDPPNPPPTPAAAPAPPTDGATPCEIAAEQVPQAGQ